LLAEQKNVAQSKRVWLFAPWGEETARQLPAVRGLPSIWKLGAIQY
jgi:hypothetical protein